MNFHWMLTAVQGLVVGATMLVPGVSGGSMAMLLGIYDRLISIVGSIRSASVRDWLFLIVFSLGACTGMTLLAGPLLRLIARHPRPVMYFFAGAIAGGMPMIAAHARPRQWGWRRLPLFLSGAAAVLVLDALPENLLQSSALSPALHFLLLCAAGFGAAAALVLPGISVSHFLLILGLHEPLIQAVAAPDFAFLIPLGIGLAAGLLLTARWLERALRLYPLSIWPVILGFAAGSVAQVFPGLPQPGDWALCAACALAGFALLLPLSTSDAQ